MRQERCRTIWVLLFVPNQNAGKPSAKNTTARSTPSESKIGLNEQLYDNATARRDDYCHRIFPRHKAQLWAFAEPERSCRCSLGLWDFAPHPKVYDVTTFLPVAPFPSSDGESIAIKNLAFLILIVIACALGRILTHAWKYVLHTWVFNTDIKQKRPNCGPRRGWPRVMCSLPTKQIYELRSRISPIAGVPRNKPSS